MKRNNCPICGEKEVKSNMKVKNWLFKDKGLEKEYLYCKCANCGVLYRQEDEIDYSKIYTDEYGGTINYFEEGENVGLQIKNKLKAIRDSYVYMNKHKIAGKMLAGFRKANYPYISEYRKRLSRGDSFLDMGCRKGEMICELKKSGANVYGAEPYLDKDIIYPNGIIVKKKFIDELEKKYDIIFYNNVLEHLEDPVTDLRKINEVLNPGGICGFLFPGSGRLLDKYKENAYIIQAPQHVMLHTEKSIRIMCEKVGMEIVSLKREPVEEWFYKSYLLQHGIALVYGESLKSIKAKIPGEEIKKIMKEKKRVRLDNNGDYYHVIFGKK